MGLGPRSYKDQPVASIPPGNPIPTRFDVSKVAVINRWTIALVRYPDARNFEGNKILMFKGDVRELLDTASALDPHFGEKNQPLNPIARFRPDDEGWNLAVKLAEAT